MTEVKQTTAQTIEYDGKEHNLHEATEVVTRAALAIGEDGESAYVVLQIGFEGIGFQVLHLKVHMDDDLTNIAMERLVQL